jgi:very-short-patch-repair endonuclease
LLPAAPNPLALKEERAKKINRFAVFPPHPNPLPLKGEGAKNRLPLFFMEYLDNLYRNTSPKIIENAKALRRSQTEAEKALWNRLKQRQIKGFKFRNQHPLDIFVLDFYCYELLLGIEVDGSIHDSTEAKEYDEGRTAELLKHGIKIIRFTNDEVLSNIDNTIKEIEKIIDELKS